MKGRPTFSSILKSFSSPEGKKFPRENFPDFFSNSATCYYINPVYSGWHKSEPQLDNSRRQEKRLREG